MILLSIWRVPALEELPGAPDVTGYYTHMSKKTLLVIEFVTTEDVENLILV